MSLSRFTKDLSGQLAYYPLLDALIERRSRRFGKGMYLNGGPLAYTSTQSPQPLSNPFAPPYYRNMEEAVLAFVEYKFAQEKGTFRDGGRTTGWKNGAKVQAGIPRYSDKAIAATIAHCDYLYRRYGRFPPNSGPFRTILAYQAHHLDQDFYDTFYRPEALSVTQRQHQSLFH